VAVSNESINKTLVLLANILDTAVDGMLASNPARGKRRRLKADRAAAADRRDGEVRPPSGGGVLGPIDELLVDYRDLERDDVLVGREFAAHAVGRRRVVPLSAA
jgi:hypothetical protein